MNLTIKDALRQGLTAHKEGKLREAERLYRAVLQSHPTHSVANHNLGVLAVTAKKFHIALPFLKTALQASPKTHQFWTSYIDTLVRDNQFEEAQNALVRAKKQDLPVNIIHTLQTKITNATPALDSRNNTPTKQRSDELWAHFTAERFSEAEALAQSLCEQFPKIPFSWKVLGVLQNRSGRIKEALFSMETAVRLRPQAADAHTTLGNVLLKLERSEDAENSLRRAIQLDPGMYASYYNLGRSLLKLGMLEKSETIYRRLILLRGDHIDTLGDLFNILRHSGRLVQSFNIIRRLYILTLSTTYIEYIQRFERKQGYLRSFRNSHRWYSVH